VRGQLPVVALIRSLAPAPHITFIIVHVSILPLGIWSTSRLLQEGSLLQCLQMRGAAIVLLLGDLPSIAPQHCLKISCKCGQTFPRQLSCAVLTSPWTSGEQLNGGPAGYSIPGEVQCERAVWTQSGLACLVWKSFLRQVAWDGDFPSHMQSRPDGNRAPSRDNTSGLVMRPGIYLA